MNQIQEITEQLIDGLNKKLEEIVIVGLKLKGYSFESRIELENFIKQRCSCVDNTDRKERIYSVDDTHFLLHNYEILFEPLNEDYTGVRMSANYGTFAYL